MGQAMSDDMIDFGGTDEVSKVGYNYLWVEKYRPRFVSKIILPESVQETLQVFIKEEEIPNLFFFSTKPGTGKTSTAKALLNDCGYEYKYINTSLKNGIDTVRTEIERYAASYSFQNKSKAVILDEFDGASHAFQSALRALIEEHKDRCRFIIICNYSYKIIEPLMSRLQEIDFNYADSKVKKELLPEIAKRVRMILKLENVKYKPEIINEFIEKKYPDIRKIIGTLQLFSKRNGVITEEILDFNIADDELVDLILARKYALVRQHVIDMNYNYDELYTLMFEHLVPKLATKSAQAECIIELAEYSDMSTRAINKEIIFCACVMKIISIINESVKQ